MQSYVELAVVLILYDVVVVVFVVVKYVYQMGLDV